MNRKSPYIFLFLLAGILAVMLFGCDGGGSGGGGGVDDNAALRIHMIAGQDGTLASTGQPDEYTLTFNNASRTVYWYTDRPERHSGQIDLAYLIENSWYSIFGSITPNATIQFNMPGGGAIEGIFVMLEYPEFNPDTGVLSFQVVLLNSTLPDPQGGTVAFNSPVMTIINNTPDQAEASSFAQYAGNAAFVSSGTEGQYTLTMDNVDPEIFWMENAPGRFSNVETVGSFVDNWVHRFGTIPPNASLVANLDSGGRILLLLTLTNAAYSNNGATVTYSATLLDDHGVDLSLENLETAVLYIDAGAGFIPSNPFSKKLHGIGYSPVPAMFSDAPLGTVFFDSDLVNDNFTAVWSTDGSCGRNDLQTMHDAGINIIRLYDYNYARGASRQGTYGKGHINFLNKAQSLGMKVIIPVSNWNFSDDQYAWENINTTVPYIIESLKVNGEIHPAVHSFSVGNELDLQKGNLDYTVLIPRAIEVAKKIHALAPDYYITIPVSTWQQTKFFEWFKNGDGQTISPLPADLYNNRFYNSVQTFKRGADLEQNILAAYDNDARFAGIPLLITELGTTVSTFSGDEGAMVDAVIDQAKVSENYMLAHADTRFKGYFIFQWQNANWKGGPTNSEAGFGIHNYDGTLCTSVTGPYKGNDPKDSASYGVDKLVQKTSTAHPDGLLTDLTKIFN